jgi:hypothetical protein
MLKLLLLAPLLVLGLPREEPDVPAATQAGGIAVLFGGYGGGVNTQIVSGTTSCQGDKSSPAFPDASFSHQRGWAAAVHKLNGEPGDVMLCGGKDVAESNECKMIEIGQSSWRPGFCKLPSARTSAAMTSTMDGSIIISGGYSEMSGWLSDIYKLTEIRPEDCDSWNPNCCTWENIGTNPGSPVYAHCSVQYDQDHLVLIGGNTWSVTNGQYDVPDIQIFNMRTGEWKKGRDMPIARQRAGCIKTEVNGRSGILVAGGFCHGNPDFEECDLLRMDSTMFYDWENDSWEDLAAPLIDNRDGLDIANIGGKILAYGGEYRGGPVTAIEEWDGSKWVQTDFKLSGGTANFASTVLPEDSYIC